ncbi:hypothetical protein MIZ03_0741 [Rhodoferax lithotrophicus]|uniref:Uncharacterized protein n=1 Tax=Rhodoferax lithotrophicus TaxID=2798804 RepID=A0ABM7MHY9_9BURK|nr:hypothetical protein MIZ03_0741 [Rhodoferax sp. MIZ03]
MLKSPLNVSSMIYIFSIKSISYANKAKLFWRLLASLQSFFSCRICRPLGLQKRHGIPPADSPSGFGGG